MFISSYCLILDCDPFILLDLLNIRFLPCIRHHSFLMNMLMYLRIKDALYFDFVASLEDE